MRLLPADRLRTAFDNLNERERKLVGGLLSVLALLVVSLPFYLINNSILAVEAENASIRAVLRDISRSRVEIAQRRAERRAAERRYDTPAPPLGGFLEGRAHAAGFTSPLQVTDQPDKVDDRFTRRHTRATLPGVGLRTAIEMLASVENSEYPVSVEQIQLDHTAMGQDRFNLQLGVFAFDRSSGHGDRGSGGGRHGRSAEHAPAKRAGGRVGPPAP